VIERSGLSQAEIAKRLGITRQTVNQAVLARRRPTLQWFAKLAGVCGAVVVVEFQDSGVS
jgi:transcriptional regulator with XRE-family HTH domain